MEQLIHRLDVMKEHYAQEEYGPFNQRIHITVRRERLVTAMKMLMKEKKETRSLKIRSLESNIIGKTRIEGMQIMMLQLRQRSMSFDQFTDRFHKLAVRSKVVETEQQTLARYHTGLSNELCKNDNEQNPATRRDLLIGLGGLYGATRLSDPFAYANPIAPPDLTQCELVTLPSESNPTNCCPQTSTKIKNFEFPSASSPMRIRPAAHLVDKAYLAKYAKAIALMKSLPDDDPRSFKNQANVHCAYCDGAYHQAGFPDLQLQIHFSWLFFPWHRAYLYYFERILGKLIDDPTFALPFWNWDAPAGMQMPAIFTDPQSPLYDPLRDANHQPPTLLDLNYAKGDANPDPAKAEELYAY
ncbi:PREDICTED: polyphenol oxidase, chloroplastic-like [Populus euphratica]|uniref:Polyphenol oxidase, chloroplastic-like n=1 Tax=Populus euphratica TaxID=75702 RepID=A0AAJ6TPZ9_POPEU|nr:PREDICTED: polyphenol oxidase, chloroplastic-like [Populus euphratica]